MASFRKLLLGSVSALALLGSAPVVMAEESHKIFFGVSGGYVMGPNSMTDAFIDNSFYNFIDIDEVPELQGNYFAVTVGAEVMPMLDVRATLAATHTEPTYTGFEYDGFDKLGGRFGEVGTGLDYQTLDLEVGYTPAIDDDFKLRLVAGVRALHYADRLEIRDKIGTPDEFGNIYENEFLGVGPRLAVEASNRFEGSPFGVSASAGGSVVFGTLEQSMNGGDATSQDKTVVTLDGKVSVDYYIGDFGKLSAGYRAEVLSGVHEFDAEAGTFEANQLTHGPVLEFLGSF